MPVQRNIYPENWEEMRQTAITAADGRCQGCGAAHMEDETQGTCLTVHHPDRDPRNRRPRLTVLCARCHLAIENIARGRQRWVKTGTRTQLPPDEQMELS